MNELRDDLLREDLAELATLARPVDLHDRVLTASRRARVRSIAGATLALVLLAGAGVAIAVWRTPTSGGLPPAGPTAPAILPEGPIISYDPTINDFDPGVLAHKTLDLPAWPGAAHCPSGSLAFIKGGAGLGNNGATVSILTVESADVDDDGSADQVAVLECVPQDQGSGQLTNAYQVVAFTDVDGASGPRTLGQVTASGTGGVAAVLGLEVTSDGTVRVKLADADGAAVFTAQVQWREYAWQGARFGQTGGETSFSTNPPEVRLALRAATESRTVDGRTYVTVRVTVANSGTIGPVAPLLLSLVVPMTLEPVDPEAWVGCVRSMEAAAGGQLVLQCPYPEALGAKDFTFWQNGSLAEVRTVYVTVDQGTDRVLERELQDNQVELTLP